MKRTKTRLPYSHLNLGHSDVSIQKPTAPFDSTMKKIPGKRRIENGNQGHGWTQMVACAWEEHIFSVSCLSSLCAVTS